LDESIIDREVGWDCTPQAKSDIYDYLVVVIVVDDLVTVMYLPYEYCVGVLRV